MSHAVYESVTAKLAQSGFDLCRAFTVHAPADFGVEFECFSLPRALGIVVGNSAAVWPHFEAFWQRRRALEHPFNAFVEEVLGEAVESAKRDAQQTLPHRIYYSHRHDYLRSNGDRGPIPMQRIAARSGLAVLGPANLNVHPQFGPWISLRAVIVLGCVPVPSERQIPKAEEPCASCSARPCVPALEAALSHEPMGGEPRWPEYRFSEAQIAFHYAGLSTIKPPPPGP
jgi:hypothetical protein